MAITILEWISRREMSSAKRLIMSPGHVSMVLLYPDLSGKTKGFAHTITWWPEKEPVIQPKDKKKVSKPVAMSSALLSVPKKWVPEDLFGEMNHVGKWTTVKSWLEKTNAPWGHAYRDHLLDLTNQQSNTAFQILMNTQIGPPERHVTIRTQGDPDSYAGLYDANIRTWWLAFADKHNTYRLFRRSCAAVVGMALVEGGAESFVSKPAGIWTPDSVYGWATKISEAVEKEHELVRAAFGSLEEEAKKFPNPGNLWTRAEWYRESEKNVSFLSRRYGELKTIDSLLDIFHSIDKRPSITKEFKKQAKLNCLTLIQKGLLQILRERGSTKRRAAIGQLAAQIKATFNYVKNEERILRQQLREKQLHEQMLLELENEKHNEPINQQLEEIFEQQFFLINLIEEAKKGKKLPEGMSIENLQFQLKTLDNQYSELENRLL